jgi:hypothetical protein
MAAGMDPVPRLRPIGWSNKPLAATAHMAAVKHQLQRLARGRPTRPEVSPLWALLGPNGRPGARPAAIANGWPPRMPALTRARSEPRS